MRLFVERARDARPDFELSEANADAVAELCVRLDGLPLALELAAARIKLLSPSAILERLGGRLELLKAAPGAGVPERHRTLRAAIEWSYDLLDGRGAGALHEPRRLRRRVHARRCRGRRRRARARRRRRRRVAPEQQPAPDGADGRRRAPLRDAGDDPRVRARAAGRARRRRGGAPPPRGLLPRARGGGRARAARATAAALARAARRRARQHPRRADLGDGERRGGRRPADRRGALALLAAARASTRRAASAWSGCWRRGSGSEARSSRRSGAVASLAVVQGDHEAVRRLGEASLPVHRTLGDDSRRSRCTLGILGILRAGDG